MWTIRQQLQGTEFIAYSGNDIDLTTKLSDT